MIKCAADDIIVARMRTCLLTQAVTQLMLWWLWTPAVASAVTTTTAFWTLSKVKLISFLRDKHFNNAFKIFGFYRELFGIL